MFCKKCGTQLPDGAANCPQCGQAVHAPNPAYQERADGQGQRNNQGQMILENLRSRFTNWQFMGMGASLLMFCSVFLSFVSAGIGFGLEETITLQELASEMDASFLFWLILGLNIAAGILSGIGRVALAGGCNIAAFAAAFVIYWMLRMDMPEEALSLLHFSTGAYLFLGGVILSVIALVNDIG